MDGALRPLILLVLLYACGSRWCSGCLTDDDCGNGACRNGTCMCDGGYTGLSCESVIRCGQLNTPGNGSLNYLYSSRLYGSVAEFHCNPGYFLIGPTYRSCDVDGNWTGFQPNCSLGSDHIRLVDGNSSNDGVVEVYSDGEWEKICADSWDGRDASVVCRMLGHTNGTAEEISNLTDSIRMTNMACDGTETFILDCKSDRLEPGECQGFGVAAVSCFNLTMVRLVGGYSSGHGTLEVFFGQRWEFPCVDHSWTDANTQVVCRMLGYSGGTWTYDYINYYYYYYYYYDRDSRRFECDGTEASIDDCNIEDSYCYHYYFEKITLACYHDNVRLVGGNNSREGVLEVYSDGQWGTVCEDEWDDTDAVVVCRMLGLKNGQSSALQLGNGTNRTLISDVRCSGSERSIFDCPHANWRLQNCTSLAVAAVSCQQNYSIRLAGGRSSNEGRVEVTDGGEWGAVCGNGWDDTDATVVCRMLGFSNGTAYRNLFKNRPIDFVMDGLNCAGNETAVWDCPYNGWGRAACFHDANADVICHYGNTIRLVSGNHGSDGRIEINIGGHWGTVCSDGWDQNDAQVACRMLGFETQYVTLPATYTTAVIHPDGTFGEGSGHILMTNVSCLGDEKSLLDCPYSTQESTQCSHAQDVSLECKYGYTLQLLNGEHSYGELRVYIEGEWRRVCYSDFDAVAGSVLCRLFGSFSNGFGYNYYTSPGIFIPVNCTGSESSINECQLGEWVSQTCDNNRVVRLHCGSVAVEHQYLDALGTDDNPSRLA